MRYRLLLHPARSLDRAGLTGAGAALRNARWALDALLPALRPQHAAKLTGLWLREPFARRRYRVLDETALRATRRSDTVFVFGSGGSLRRLTPQEWSQFAEHDVVGFSHFHRQRWIRVDYHLVAEVASIPETAASMRANPLYADTVYGMTKGWIAEAANAMIVHGLLQPGTRIFRWRRKARGRVAPPSRRLSDGLVHGAGSIQDVVNFALVLGWRRVVIVGVDLYDSGYFWVTDAPDRPDLRWAQSETVLATMRLWKEYADRDGVELLVYSPRSLLAEVLPVFSGDDPVVAP